MVRIKLNRGAWSFDPARPLGPPGGFGAVLLGAGPGKEQVAVKRLHVMVSDAAHRELRIAEELVGKDLQHVMVVLDSGQDSESDHYFVVMPRAERSLQAELDAKGMLPEREAVAVLSHIVTGLCEIPKLVHRDLKPGNVLWHDGRWKIADFGIARFVEESTSLRTLKECLTPAYAAPEQWRQDRVTSATDVYALGCIAVALLTGRPPFEGGVEEVRRAHLEKAPAGVTAIPELRSLVAMMLRKAPEARPSYERILAALSRILEGGGITGRSGSALDELAVAGSKIAEEEARREEVGRKVQSEREERSRLAEEASRILQANFDDLYDRIRLAAPNAVRATAGSGPRIYLGSAVLELDLPSTGMVIDKGAFPRSRWDVVARAEIRVAQSSPPYVWEASLWYTTLGKGTEWRWYEVGYMDSPMIRAQHRYAPFALGVEGADEAAGPGMGIVQFAYNPRIIDDEHLDSFCERWSRLLANATQGKLEHPRSLPLSTI